MSSAGSLAPTDTSDSPRNGVSFTKVGDGPALVLLHGIGASRAAWAPVLERLTTTHTVYAVDLPGFGDSAPLGDGAVSSPRRLAEAVAGALDELGLETPHVAGHSLGGWVALELADLRPVASLTLLSPAGLWKGGQPAYCAVSLYVTWAGCRYGASLFNLLSRSGWGRRLALWQFFAHPERLRPDEVRRDVTTMADGAGFVPTMRAVRNLRYQAGRELPAPVTVAFGSADRVLLARQSRFTDQLPPHTRHRVIADAGHVLMSDAPGPVADLILEATGDRAGAIERSGL
jgi:pimeloyl-ACP methyl ester carboxylesterase